MVEVYKEELKVLVIFMIVIDKKEVDFMFVLFVIIIIVGEFFEFLIYVLLDVFFFKWLGDDREYYGRICMWGLFGWVVVLVMVGFFINYFIFKFC